MVEVPRDAQPTLTMLLPLRSAGATAADLGVVGGATAESIACLSVPGDAGTVFWKCRRPSTNIGNAVPAGILPNPLL